MPNQLTASGLQIATQAELLAQLTAAYQAIYGADINIASDTPDGQAINIFIQAILDVEDLLSQVYSSMDPDNAIGVTLDQRVAINGIQRQAGTYTNTNISITINSACTLQGLDLYPTNPYTVSDSAGVQWQLQTTQNPNPSVPTVYVYSFQAANPGATLTTPNTINVPVTVVPGVTLVNNPTTYSSLGLNEETDAALRIRRQKSVSLPSQGFLQGLLAALENIPGITSAFVYENDTSSTNGDGVPGHSIWVIVAGNPVIQSEPSYSTLTTYAYGDLVSQSGLVYISVINNNLGNPVSDISAWAVYNPVAQTIYVKRNAGAGMYGQTSYTIIQIDGTPFTIYWDTVQAESLYIKFSAISLNGTNAPNVAAINSQLPSLFVPGVNAQVNINQLASIVQSIDPNTLVSNAGFSTVPGGPYFSTLTPATKKNQFVVTSGDTFSPSISPYNATVATSATQTFTASFGSSPYAWSKVSGVGSIDPVTGIYTAPVTAGNAVIAVLDSLNNIAYANVTVQ